MSNGVADGVAGAVIVAFLGWLRWSFQALERRYEQAADHRHSQLLQSLQQQHERTAESLRQALADRHDLFTTAVSVGSATNLAAQQRRVEVIQEFWSSFLEIKGRTYWPFTGLQRNFGTDPSRWEVAARTYAAWAEGEGGWRALSQWVEDRGHAIEAYRPMIGEQLWQLTRYYCMILGRAAINASTEVHKSGVAGNPTTPVPWFVPELDTRILLDRFISKVLPAASEAWIWNEPDRGFRTLLELLEGAIVFEIQVVLSGAGATRAHIEEGKLLADSLSGRPTEEKHIRTTNSGGRAL